MTVKIILSERKLGRKESESRKEKNMADTFTVYRREDKYEINYIQMQELSELLSQTLVEDQHNQHMGYMVRSVYFDTYDHYDYYSKLEGLEERKKIRLRIYGAGSNQVKLEQKEKKGSFQRKTSLSLEAQDAKEILNGNYEVLRKLNTPVASKFYAILSVEHRKPVSMVEYRRKAYIHPMNQIRLTIDYDIRVSETEFDLFGAAPVLLPAEDTFFALLEVKYNGFLFQWIGNLLERFELHQSSYSKYMVSRQNI